MQIRLFGDPNEAGLEAPTLSISVNVRFESPSASLRRQTSHDVTPDFVEGTAFGDALGVGLRCLSTSWWTVTALSPSPQLREAVRTQRTCNCGIHHLSLSCCRGSNFPCSQMFDSPLDRRVFSRSEFHNPRHLTGMHSRSTYMPPLALPR